MSLDTPPSTSKGRRTAKYVIWAAIGLLVLLIVTNSGGSDEPSNTTVAAPLTTPVTTMRTTTTMATTTTIRLPGIGDPVRDGNFEFIVHSVSQPATPPDTFEEPVGTWVQVELSVTNIKNDQQSFFSTNQTLVVNGAEYVAAFTLDSMFDINPGLSTTVTLLFDVPPAVLQAQSVQVELHDSAFSGGVEFPPWAGHSVYAAV